MRSTLYFAIGWGAATLCFVCAVVGDRVDG
jgi:hypothetical protein